VHAAVDNKDGTENLDTKEWVQLWDISEPSFARRLGAPLEGNDVPVVSLHFSGDGRALWSANRKVTLFRWDVTDPAKPRRDAEAVRERYDRRT
jgi:WD40 repeat protein